MQCRQTALHGPHIGAHIHMDHTHIQCTNRLDHALQYRLGALGIDSNLKQEGFMMSCEPKRTSAYSNDLRWHMVYIVEMQHKPYHEVAENLAVDPSTVYRTVSLFSESGNVNKRKHQPKALLY